MQASKTYAMADIRKAVPLWFSPDTMRFFRTRVGRYVYQGGGGIYFVTSEQYRPGASRLYSVRRFWPEADEISTVGEFQGYKTRALAIGAAKRAASGEG